MTFGRAHRHRPEECVVGSLGQQRGDGRIGQIESMVADQHGEPRRVATTHLQSIESGQRLLYRGSDLDGRPRCVRADKSQHRTGRGQPVALDGPGRVLQAQESGIGGFEVGAVGEATPVELDVERGGPGADVASERAGTGCQVGIAQQGRNAVGAS